MRPTQVAAEIDAPRSRPALDRNGGAGRAGAGIAICARGSRAVGVIKTSGGLFDFLSGRNSPVRPRGCNRRDWSGSIDWRSSRGASFLPLPDHQSARALSLAHRQRPAARLSAGALAQRSRLTGAVCRRRAAQAVPFLWPPSRPRRSRLLSWGRRTPPSAAACAQRPSAGVAGASGSQLLSRGFNLTSWIERRGDPGARTRRRWRVCARAASAMSGCRSGGASAPPCSAAAMAWRAQLAELDTAVDTLIRLGFGVSLDLHPGDRFGRLHVSDPSRGFELIEAALADAGPPLCRPKPHRLFLEVLNEPTIAPTLWNEQGPRLVQAIGREVPNHTIIYGPADFQQIGALAELVPLGDRNLVYAAHFYEPMVFTHQGLDWSKTTRCVSSTASRSRRVRPIRRWSGCSTVSPGAATTTPRRSSSRSCGSRGPKIVSPASSRAPPVGPRVTAGRSSSTSSAFSPEGGPCGSCALDRGGAPRRRGALHRLGALGLRRWFRLRAPGRRARNSGRGDRPGAHRGPRGVAGAAERARAVMRRS